MSNSARVMLVLLRVALGSLFLYSGLSKVLDPSWSADFYLNNAQTFPAVFQWLAQASVLPLVNFMNMWGQLLLGVSLILGAFVRLSSTLGVLLMLLYYIPILRFPYVGQHALIVDEHVIYGLVLLFFYAVDAGKVLGLDKLFFRSRNSS